MKTLRQIYAKLSASRLRLMVLAASGSATLLAVAYVFQALGYVPCQLCWWQRYPHMLAVAVIIVALVWRPSAQLAWVGALAALATALIGIYHTGVEQKWWPGPDTCTAGTLGEQSAQDLLNQLMATPMVRCDEVAWSLMGISMASMNAIASFALMAIWIAAARRK
ncbi:disulfide bond formation protein B [Phaeovulum sp.]|uniref:disulfide bond formation protein B n=1 Tax=Phaeovulum sp. TaxID=2934796 RepID=UPI0035697234